MMSPIRSLSCRAVATDGQTFGEKELRIGRLLVGRTPENDLQIDSKYVSRHHCQITVALEGEAAHVGDRQEELVR